MLTRLLIWIVPIILLIILIVFQRTCCINYYDKLFPTKGHAIILILISLIPIAGLIELIIYIIVHIVMRCENDLRLVHNKFTEKFFDITEDD